ncbi:MAPEG family protein [Tsuneonella dongtanensis]|uniref:MAPEG family protein n=1 Tax=Tsuneonella dongtanensis TaxID=692370 RepID=A0A1B2AE48_9SPHN|nr:MAPEG family protein [Tsuneonella dongtanensis]ANY20371.1 MAPEG family protein [Tsuneonella dongtanensis]
MQAQILAPAAVLVVWSIVMLIWTAGTRFPAIFRLEDKSGIGRPGGRGQDLEQVLPAKVNWKSHNYTHLMEQPTIFYPTVIILALMGASPSDVLFAWIYVAVRVVHSIWQATVNRIPVRILLFGLMTIALAKLAISALMVTLFANPGVVA